MRGVLDVFADIISATGVNAETAKAVELAYQSPSIDNINAVELAFTNAGSSAPPELMQNLWERYYQAVRDNPLWASGNAIGAISNWLPWILIGGVALFAFSSISKRSQ